MFLPGESRDRGAWWAAVYGVAQIQTRLKRLSSTVTRNPRSNCQHSLDHRKNKGIPKKKIYFCFIDYAKVFDYVDHNKLWKILKEMGVPDHLICLLRNLYVGQEATVRIGHGTTGWFKTGEGLCQGCILSPCLFNFYEEHICDMLGWRKHKLESRLPGEISIASDMQMISP